MPANSLRALAALLSVVTLGAAPRPPVVAIATSLGTIDVRLDTVHAPRTTANFLHYVDEERLDDTDFFRAARATGAPSQGFIEGGIGTDARRTLASVPLEPTDRTGIRHTDATLSMARNPDPNSATGNFSITVGPAPGLDARPGAPGYAAFGHVLSGMDVVRRILAGATFPGGEGAFKGQMLVHRVKIISVRRIDGVPTSRPPAFKPWALGVRR